MLKQKVSTLKDENQEAERNIVLKNLEDFKKEMEGSTYKIMSNNKKINIQCSVFEGKNEKYGLVSMADVTNVQNYER